MATRKPRVKVTMTPEELERIEDFMKRFNYPDRSMAMHDLTIQALDMAEGKEDPTPKIHRREKTGGVPDET